MSIIISHISHIINYNFAYLDIVIVKRKTAFDVIRVSVVLFFRLCCAVCAIECLQPKWANHRKTVTLCSVIAALVLVDCCGSAADKSDEWRRVFTTHIPNWLYYRIRITGSVKYASRCCRKWHKPPANRSNRWVEKCCNKFGDFQI